MNKTIRRLLYAAAGLGVVGAVLIGGVYVTTGSTRLSYLQYYHHNNNGNHGNMSLTDFNETYDQIQQLEVDCSYCSVQLIERDIDEVNVSGRKNDETEMTITNENGKLTITMHRKNEVIGNAREDTLIIALPRNTELNESSIQVSMGEIDVSQTTLSNSSISIDMGEIEMDNVTLDNADLSCNMGDISFEGRLMNDISVTNDMGSVEMDLYHRVNEISYSISNNLGEIEYNDRNLSEFSGTHEQIADNEQAYLTIENSMGSVSVDFDD